MGRSSRRRYISKLEDRLMKAKISALIFSIILLLYSAWKMSSVLSTRYGARLMGTQSENQEYVQITSQKINETKVAEVEDVADHATKQKEEEFLRAFVQAIEHEIQQKKMQESNLKTNAQSSAPHFSGIGDKLTNDEQSHVPDVTAIKALSLLQNITLSDGVAEHEVDISDVNSAQKTNLVASQAEKGGSTQNSNIGSAQDTNAVSPQGEVIVSSEGTNFVAAQDVTNVAAQDAGNVAARDAGNVAQDANAIETQVANVVAAQDANIVAVKEANNANAQDEPVISSHQRSIDSPRGKENINNAPQTPPVVSPSSEKGVSNHNDPSSTRSVNGGENPKVHDAMQLYSNMADITPKRSGHETPVFWLIPKSGGLSFKEAFGACLGLTLACEVGSSFVGQKRKIGSFSKNKKRYVNVDTMSREGIKEAGRMRLAASRVSDVVVVAHVQEVNSIFTRKHQGRIFALFRHPVERALSLHCDSLRGTAQSSAMVADDGWLAKYIKTNVTENNWMTRFLSNELHEPLTNRHFELAKQTLEKKILVGLLAQKEESLRRFRKFFGWNWERLGKKEQRSRCMEKVFSTYSDYKCRAATRIVEGSETYNVLARNNKYDMKLYEHAEELFKNQKKLFGNEQTTQRKFGFW